jgi:hypothetical protein
MAPLRSPLPHRLLAESVDDGSSSPLGIVPYSVLRFSSTVLKSEQCSPWFDRFLPYISVCNPLLWSCPGICSCLRICDSISDLVQPLNWQSSVLSQTTRDLLYLSDRLLRHLFIDKHTTINPYCGKHRNKLSRTQTDEIESHHHLPSCLQVDASFWVRSWDWNSGHQWCSGRRMHQISC